MKHLPLLLSALFLSSGFLSGIVIADGAGYKPVAVIVVNGNGIPIQGAEVRLEGIRPHEETEVDPAKQQKALNRSLGRKEKTDDRGTVILYYYGSWSSVSGQGSGSVSEETPKVSVVVQVGGKEVYRKPLAEWRKEQQCPAAACAAPFMIVEVR